MAIRGYSNSSLSRCRRFRPCGEVCNRTKHRIWMQAYTLLHLLIADVDAGGLHQIIGKLSDEGLHLFVVKRRIITNESALAHLLQEKVRGALKMCVAFICAHRKDCLFQCI